MQKLTAMQQKIYDYIANTVRNQGYPPSVREIGEAVGLKSPSTVHFHIKHLEELGYISKSGRKGRALTLTERAAPAAAAPAPAQEAEMPSGRVPVLGDVHRQPTAQNGEIVVALLEDEATVKRLSRRGGEVWLLPENENYSPIDGRYASILGKVAAVLRTYS